MNHAGASSNEQVSGNPGWFIGQLKRLSAAQMNLHGVRVGRGTDRARSDNNECHDRHRAGCEDFTGL